MTGDPVPWPLVALAGAVVGAMVAWLVLRARVARLEGERDAERALAARTAPLPALLAPLEAQLGQAADLLARLDQRRGEHYGALAERLDLVTQASEALRAETRALGTALRAPQVRGQWGELQLRRTVELAGMLEHCDFVTQATVRDESTALRPDLLVRLAGGRTVVVDAKAPLAAWLEAVSATDETARRALLARHAQQVRAHVQLLAQKRYWAQFPEAPEFVVLFLPGEALFAAALEADPALLDAGAEQRVLLATPTTLIALLRAAAWGWREERLARGAAEVSALGRELHERLAVMSAHFGAVGESLGRAVEAYNRTLASLEARVLTSARRFEALGAASPRSLDPAEPVTAAPRRVGEPTPPLDPTA
jgi:DNA recombination protein RmuC